MAFVERLNLERRQHMVAVGRHVNTLCTQEAIVSLHPADNTA
jgi:hypothetical protein